VARSTFCAMVHRAAGLLEAVYARLMTLACEHPYVHADETKLRIGEPKLARDGWVWTALWEFNVRIPYLGASSSTFSAHYSIDRARERPFYGFVSCYLALFSPGRWHFARQGLRQSRGGSMLRLIQDKDRRRAWQSCSRLFRPSWRRRPTTKQVESPPLPSRRERCPTEPASSAHR
jgi:hypothetical protein